LEININDNEVGVCVVEEDDAAIVSSSFKRERVNVKGEFSVEV